MRKLARNVAALAAGITLSVAACGDDDGPTGSNSGDALTSVEAQELASEVLNVLFNIGFTERGLSSSARTSPREMPKAKVSAIAATRTVTTVRFIVTTPDTFYRDTPKLTPDSPHRSARDRQEPHYRGGDELQ